MKIAQSDHRFTKAEADAFLRTWVRIVEEDGSTVAYVPDETTARRFIEANDSREAVIQHLIAAAEVLMRARDHDEETETGCELADMMGVDVDEAQERIHEALELLGVDPARLKPAPADADEDKEQTR